MYVCGKLTKNLPFRLKQIKIWTNENIIYCLYVHTYICT